MNQYINLSAEIEDAIESSKPVVALESTIISHGMPYPHNLETALEVESIVRQNGAIPATIALIGGRCHVGLSKEELESFAKRHDVWKVSLRDIAYVLSKGLYGATTVAATMRIASWAGIRVFVTGGIGGVHRGAEKTMDISADLTELSQTSVAVISAGVKSILDIGLTLEYLETLGVPVVTYRTDEFPSFYSTKSGFRSPLRLDRVDEIASMIRLKWQMGLNGSVLIANPLPGEHEIEASQMELHILEALRVAEENNIKGNEVTPFLLSYIAEHTSGESLQANIALIKNNAKLGAAIAKSYSELK